MKSHPVPEPDPETVRRSLEAFDRGEYVSTQILLIEIQERIINRLRAELKAAREEKAKWEASDENLRM